MFHLSYFLRKKKNKMAAGARQCPTGALTRTFIIFGATQEHLCSAHLEEDQDQDETKRTGVVDSSSDRSRATE